MTKKNIHIALSSLVLLGAAAYVQAEEQTEELLQYSSLGTGEEIREEILADDSFVEENLTAEIAATESSDDMMMRSDEDQDEQSQMDQSDSQYKTQPQPQAQPNQNQKKKNNGAKKPNGTPSGKPNGTTSGKMNGTPSGKPNGTTNGKMNKKPNGNKATEGKCGEGSCS